MVRSCTTAVVVASLLVPGIALAQAASASGRARAGTDYMQIRSQRACADTEHANMLANQLRMRLPETMVVRGELETSGQWVVDWVEQPDGCVVLFRSGETTSSMTLEKNAELEQIELAASRIAFLASVSQPNGGGSGEPALGVPGEEIARESVEDAESETTAPSENTDESPPDEDSTDPPGPKKEGPASDGEPDQSAESSGETTPAERPRYFKPAIQFFLVPGLGFPTPRPPGSAPEMAVGLLGTTTAGSGALAASSVFNIQYDYMDGLQSAGVFNIAGDARGIQTAGVFNTAAAVTGTQLAGVFNYSGGGRLGLQVAGVTNIHDGQFDGVQVAGVVNVADSLGGVQAAVVANVASEVSGLQLGLVNVGSRIDGTQVGLVNIARESDFSFGLINVIWSEPFWLLAETGSDGYTMAGIRHGSRYLKWSLWAGTSLVADSPVLLAGIGLGFHLPFDRFHLDFDVIGLDVSGQTAPFSNAGVLDVRLSAGWSFFERFALVGGLGFRNFFSDGDDFGLVPGFASPNETNAAGQPTIVGWPHAFIGVRI